MELIEEETEIYNSKMHLLMWLHDELTLNPEMKDELNIKGQNLPLNV